VEIKDFEIVLDILSFLCDSDETLDIIVDILDGRKGELRGIYTPQNVLPILLELLEEEKIHAGIDKKTTDMLSCEWCRVEKIDMKQMDEYWFRITDKGRKFYEDVSK